MNGIRQEDFPRPVGKFGWFFQLWFFKLIKNVDGKFCNWGRQTSKRDSEVTRPCTLMKATIKLKSQFYIPLVN